MGLDLFHSILEQSSEFQDLVASLKLGHGQSKVQMPTSAAAFAIGALCQNAKIPMLVIVPRPEDARNLANQILIWSDDETAVLHFPETENLPFERLVSDVDTIHHRLSTLNQLTSRKDLPTIVVASTAAIAQKTLSKKTFESSNHTLRVGDNIVLDEMLDMWGRIGYRIEPTTDAPGLASRRGGIVDLFPVDADLPFRIEFWGNNIDSIRTFDPSTQRSISNIESITISQAKETLPGLLSPGELKKQVTGIDLQPCTAISRERISRELNMLIEGQEVEEIEFYSGLFNQGSLLDYFPQDGSLLLYKPLEISAEARGNDLRALELRSIKESRGELPPDLPSSRLDWDDVEVQASRIRVSLEITPWGAHGLTNEEVIVLPFGAPPDFSGNLVDFSSLALDIIHQRHRIVAVTSSPKRLVEVLGKNGVDADNPSSIQTVPIPGSVTVVGTAGGTALEEGFTLSVNDCVMTVLSDSELFGAYKQRRSTKRRTSVRRNILSDLTPGDYVVHIEHGIGRFKGTDHPPKDSEGQEHLIVEYASGDLLYVPMDHLERVAPYVAPLDRVPSLTRLGTQEWQRTRARVEQSTKKMAAELLTLYASRELAEGTAFPTDTTWQAELEDSFPFEETEDQTVTISEVKTDMERKRPMDRLVCGDVGYGKTEVAIRASFKSVMDGKQVAVLVPTTILAQQHYATFSQRLNAYPVTIEVLSRFRTDKDQRAVLDRVSSGKVDICIGTHRLVQKDVTFKDLGLVVIDEEQRFGVVHKERLKQMRNEVDVLTMTATPIPRTLHLSLAGIRDMSTIETPPEERLPIKTYVSEFSDELIKEAIRRELDRHGQVFFLHNRVQNLNRIADHIRMLAPEATVGIAHGQMRESQLERTMLDFSDGTMDVLVCTTIIESGLDIPNVNTLIVDRADTFGLSQLYQLRGRVGRGARRAYAYLLLPAHRSISETAEKRLKTMLAATELGAGFQIAMKDLEIRGAGNVLGAAQSGHIHAVGFDLYTRILAEAVEDLRADRESGESAGRCQKSEDVSGVANSSIPRQQTAVTLDIPASIPEDYVSDLPTRLELYRRIGSHNSFEEVTRQTEEMRDRFGPLPLQVENLIYIVRLRLLAKQAGVQSIHRDRTKIVLRLHDEIGGARPALQKILGGPITVGNSQIRIQSDFFTDSWQLTLSETVSKLASFRERLGATL